jgi:hypothetical protein
MMEHGLGIYWRGEQCLFSSILQMGCSMRELLGRPKSLSYVGSPNGQC